jgi:hypothetical protein
VRSARDRYIKKFAEEPNVCYIAPVNYQEFVDALKQECLIVQGETVTDVDSYMGMRIQTSPLPANHLLMGCEEIVTYVLPLPSTVESEERS